MILELCLGGGALLLYIILGWLINWTFASLFIVSLIIVIIFVFGLLTIIDKIKFYFIKKNYHDGKNKSRKPDGSFGRFNRESQRKESDFTIEPAIQEPGAMQPGDDVSAGPVESENREDRRGYTETEEGDQSDRFDSI